MKTKSTVHFMETTLLNPTNPISVNLIGTGGTGSTVLTALGRINHSLVALGHAGLFVRAFDSDTVQAPNLGRQLFTESEIGLNKSVALINRLNRFFGTAWEAVESEFNSLNCAEVEDMATLTISCVDTVKSRQEIAEVLTTMSKNKYHRNRPVYWMDFGNGKDNGQVIFSTICRVEQPASKKFYTANALPLITTEFGSLLAASEKNVTGPSCSLAEALNAQNLFINSALAQVGCSLLWNGLRTGYISNRGFFFDLANFKMQPIKIATPQVRTMRTNVQRAA